MPVMEQQLCAEANGEGNGAETSRAKHQLVLRVPCIQSRTLVPNIE